MKILFLLPFLNMGGMEQKAVLLAKGLVAQGHEVHVAQFVGGGKLEPAMRDACTRLITIDRGPYRPPRNLRVPGLKRLQRWVGLWRVARAFDYDIVYGFEYEQNLYAATATRGLKSKIVWGVEGRTSIQGQLGRLLERQTVRYADLIITVSNDMRRYCLNRGFPADRTVVIENGVDTGRFRIEPAWRNEVRTELGLGEDHILIGMIGRLDPVKNIEGFLHAAVEVARSDERVKILILGPTKHQGYTEALKALTTELGLADRVIWLGSRPDPERYFNALDVYVSASHSEGLSLALLEAMACGRTCVTTDVGDSERVLGAMGVVVPSRDTAALAAAMTEVVRSGDIRSPETIRKRVRDWFSADRQVERTEAALLALVGESDSQRLA